MISHTVCTHEYLPHNVSTHEYRYGVLEATRTRLRRVAADLGLVHGGRHNLGPTWLGTPETVITMANATIPVSARCNTALSLQCTITAPSPPSLHRSCSVIVIRTAPEPLW